MKKQKILPLGTPKIIDNKQYAYRIYCNGEWNEKEYLGTLYRDIDIQKHYTVDYKTGEKKLKEETITEKKGGKFVSLPIKKYIIDTLLDTTNVSEDDKFIELWTKFDIKIVEAYKSENLYSLEFNLNPKLKDKDLNEFCIDLLFEYLVQ